MGRRVRTMFNASTYMILVNRYIEEYEKETDAIFKKLYEGDRSLGSQIEIDNSVDRYSAFSQNHQKSIIDIGESLVMLTNLFRVAAVTSMDNNHMRPSPVASRVFRSTSDLLMPLIELLSKTGQYSNALHLLDQFTDRPYDPKFLKEKPYLTPKKHELLFLCKPLIKHETNVNLLEKTVSIFMKINEMNVNKSDHLFLPSDQVTLFTEKFQPKDTLEKKLKSLEKSGWEGQGQGQIENRRGFAPRNRDNNRRQARD